MLAPFLIMLREGLEAALIVGIIAGYLRQTGRGAWLPAVWIGIFLAVALSLFAGAALQLVSAGFPQKAQELFEAVIGFLAVGVLMGMVFWMRRAARSIKVHLHAGIDEALAEPGRGATWALIGMVFLATAREGLESVFFLLAIFQQSPDAMAPLGALLGVLLAAVAGWGIYAGMLRIDLRRFFRWTGVLVIFVAAGLAASAFAVEPWRRSEYSGWRSSQLLMKGQRGMTLSPPSARTSSIAARARAPPTPKDWKAGATSVWTKTREFPCVT